MATVTVHETTYELPESLTLKEMRIIERYCDGHLEGWDISKMCGAIHVAIMRAKPELGFEEIQGVIDDLPVEELEQAFSAVEAGQSPPAESKSESSESSSEDSTTSSAAVPANETPESTGSQDLDGFRSFHATSRN